MRPIRRLALIAAVTAVMTLSAEPGAAEGPVVRKAPFDAGRMCSVHPDVYYKYVYETCFVNPDQGRGSDPLDPITFQFNYVAASARMGALVAGGYETLYLPPVPTTYVYNVHRSATLVFYRTPGPGTLSVSADIKYAVASFPIPRAYRTCLEVYDITPGRGPFPFTGHILLKNDCVFEDSPMRSAFNVSVSVNESMPISLEAVLSNAQDNSAAAAWVENITYTFTPS